MTQSMTLLLVFALFLLFVAWYLHLEKKKERLRKTSRELKYALHRKQLGLSVLDEHKKFYEEDFKEKYGLHQ